MAEHGDEMQRKMLIMALIAVILGAAISRFIGAVTHHTALGFVAVVVFGWLSFSLLFLWLRHQ